MDFQDLIETVFDEKDIKAVAIKNLEEYLADKEHDSWSRWMKYLFSKSTMNNNGSCTMPKWAVNRWTREMNTPYSELSEKEKQSDRDEIQHFLELLGYKEEK